MIIKYAKVMTEDFKVKFLGENEISEMNYIKLSDYIPKKGDVVAFIVDNKNKYLCIGKVG